MSADANLFIGDNQSLIHCWTTHKGKYTLIADGRSNPSLFIQDAKGAYLKIKEIVPPAPMEKWKNSPREYFQCYYPQLFALNDGTYKLYLNPLSIQPGLFSYYMEGLICYFQGVTRLIDLSLPDEEIESAVTENTKPPENREAGHRYDVKVTTITHFSHELNQYKTAKKIELTISKLWQAGLTFRKSISGWVDTKEAAADYYTKTLKGSSLKRAILGRASKEDEKELECAFARGLSFTIIVGLDHGFSELKLNT